MSDEGAQPYLPIAGLRSRALRDDVAYPCVTTGQIERHLNFALALQEIASVEPIVGIAQANSGLPPCSRHHIAFAMPIRTRIRHAGGLVTEFASHPIQQAFDRAIASTARRKCFRPNSIRAAAADRRIPIAVESVKGY